MADLAASAGLVLDTSVLINLMATDAMEDIVAALPCVCHVPEAVVIELKRSPITGAAFARDAHPVQHMAPDVAVVALDAVELEIFIDLVSASTTDALGDGEAAAIAVAVQRRLALVVDDRKARRIARERFSDLNIYWTVDILQSVPVNTALGAARAEDCFEKARRYGRMHLPKR